MKWLNRTVLGIGLASLFSDFSHEIATALLPTFLATMGVAAAWLGIIEGVSDGLSSVAKMGSGFYTDKLQRRKPIAVIGYVVTALGTASFGLATTAWHVLIARSSAWLGRGVRTPVKKALLAAAVTKETYGRAFGFERMMDTIGAIVGPATALLLLAAFHHRYQPLFALTLIPGLTAAALIAFLVKEKERKPVAHVSFSDRLRSLPKPYRKFLVAVGLFGSGDFAHSMLILLATQKLAPAYGTAKAASFAVGFYVAHNVFYAAFAPIAGWLADRFKKPLVLSAGYALAAIMAVLSCSAASTSASKKPWKTPSALNWSTKNNTAWPSASSQPSTASATSFPASWLDYCGRVTIAPSPSPTAQSSSRWAPSSSCGHAPPRRTGILPVSIFFPSRPRDLAEKRLQPSKFQQTNLRLNKVTGKLKSESAIPHLLSPRERIEVRGNKTTFFSIACDIAAKCIAE